MALVLGLTACPPSPAPPVDKAEDPAVDTDDPTVEPEVPSGNPDDPPPLDPTVPEPFSHRVGFLYEGDEPVQIDVEDGAIDDQRVAVLKGLVYDRAGNPIEGVRVSIRDHAEYGHTFTRDDGAFDMAVNGGGPLMVDFSHDDFLPVFRRPRPGWRSFERTHDVVMVALDDQVTSVDLSSGDAIQCARGSEVSDADGTRQATLMFPSGLGANMVMPDGSTQPLSTLDVRLTEYTVGDTGPESMPADLPATSAFTYAVELSVDEALTAGAVGVDFDQPVPFYLENFLGFDTGVAVPAGYLDPATGFWVAEPDGVVVEVTAITDGLAQLDTDGDGDADLDDLTPWDITEAELEELAELYEPGDTLWRIGVAHFSAWDFNWSHGPPPSCDPAITSCWPDQPPPHTNDSPRTGDDTQCGSVIGCQAQTLGESLPIKGTPYRLHYNSGRSDGANSGLSIPLSGSDVPPDLLHITADVYVEGQHAEATFPPDPNQVWTFGWDGKDAYGRTLPCSGLASVVIGYAYQAHYYPSEPSFAGAFARSGNGGSIVSDGPVGRDVLTMEQRWIGSIGGCKPTMAGLGGWNLDVHHVFDGSTQTLYSGDGTVIDADILSPVVDHVAGNLTTDAVGLDASAPQHVLDVYLKPSDVAFDADGNMLIANYQGGGVWSVNDEGMLDLVAGGAGWESAAPVDGQLAAEVNLSSCTYGGGYPPANVMSVGPQGTLFVTGCVRPAGGGSTGVVFRVDPDGRIFRVAGGGDEELTWHDGGGWATDARLDAIADIAAGPTGELYLLNYQTVFKVDTDGRIFRVAGGGYTPALATDDPLAMDFGGISIVADPSGDLYIGALVDEFSGSGQRHTGALFRLTPDGRIFRLAGSLDGFEDFTGGADGLDVNLPAALGLAVGADGTVYWSGWTRIYAISPDGWVTHLGGDGDLTWDVDVSTQKASTATFHGSQQLTEGPDGWLYFVDVRDFGRIARIRSPFPDTWDLSETAIPSADGSEIHPFSGRHERTLSGETGEVLRTFDYDADGLLIGVTDADGNTTMVERDGSGAPTAIVGPDGHRTEMAVSSDGDLTGFTDPLGNAYAFDYRGTSGLLTSMTTPTGDEYTFDYDSLGRLLRDSDPIQGATAGKSLVRYKEGDDDYSVVFSSAEGVTTDYQVIEHPDGSVDNITWWPDGTSSTFSDPGDGTLTRILSDGGEVRTELGYDPRFGMIAPTHTSTWTSPSGREFTVSEDRQMWLADPDNDPWTVAVLTETHTIGGESYIDTLDVAARSRTLTSPLGRQMTIASDAVGRPEQVTRPGFADLEVTWDNRGRLSAIERGGRALYLDYGPGGAVSEISNAAGESMQFLTDGAGRVTEMIGLDGASTTLRWDARDNLVAVTPPGRAEHQIGFNAIDLPTSQNPPGTGTRAMSYNLDRQPVRVDRADGDVLTTTYDSAGRVISETSPRGTFDVAWDAPYPSAVTTPEGDTLSVEMDGPLVTRTAWSGAVNGAIDFDYDAQLRVDAVTVAGSTVSYGYDADGQLVTAGDLTVTRDPLTGLLDTTSSGQVNTVRGSNAFGEVVAMDATWPGGGSYGYTLTRDVAGRIIERTETIDGVPSTTTYTYDAGRRLTGVRVDGVLTYEYAWGDNGTRTQATWDGEQRDATTDGRDRLQTFGTESWSYDEAGDLTAITDGGTTRDFAYDAFGNLLSATAIDGSTVSYRVDGANRRIQRSHNGVVTGYLWQDDLRIEALLDGADNVTARFVYGESPNVPELMYAGGETYRLIADHLGSVRVVVNAATGQVMQRRDYDPFGRVLIDTAPGFQPFGFAGGLHDPATELVRFGARDYHPATGRWTTLDPLGFAGGDTNQYRYAFGDPVNFTDPSGEILPVLAGAAACAAGVCEAIAVAAVATAVALLGMAAVDTWVVPWATTHLNQDRDPDDDCDDSGGDDLMDELRRRWNDANTRGPGGSPGPKPRPGPSGPSGQPKPPGGGPGPSYPNNPPGGPLIFPR